MKKIMIILLTGVVFCSCSSNHRYEKAIADFVQTDSRGVKHDLQFKALEVKKLEKITVGDSLSFMIRKTEAERSREIRRWEYTLQSSRDSLAGDRPMSEFRLRFHTKSIENARLKIEEAKAWDPQWANPYENLPKDKVLAIVVQCRYSMVPRTGNARREYRKDFILSPDGKNCLRIRTVLERF